MNRIEESLGRKAVYMHTDKNGDTYPVYGGGGPYVPPEQRPANNTFDAVADAKVEVNNLIKRGQSPLVYNDSASGQATTNERNAVGAKKWENMKQTNDVQRMVDSSKAEVLNEVRPHVQKLLDENNQYKSLINGQIEKEEQVEFRRKVDIIKKDMTPYDISNATFGTQAALNQGQPAPNSPLHVAAREHLAEEAAKKRMSIDNNGLLK